MKMKWLLLALLVLLGLGLLILITRIKIYLDYYHGNDNDHLKLTIKAWAGLIKYKIDVPVIKIDDNSPTVIAEEKIQSGPEKHPHSEKVAQMDKNDLINSLNDFKKLLVHVTGLHEIVRQFLAKVSVRNLEWHSHVGLGDAAGTGVVTGVLWGIKGSIIGVLSHYMKLKEMPIISVTPRFQQPVSVTSFKCIFQVRVGHAILAGLKLVKFWKGGWPEFKTKPLSILSSDKTKSV